MKKAGRKTKGFIKIKVNLSMPQNHMTSSILVSDGDRQKELQEEEENIA
jgi:hypothetical protein